MMMNANETNIRQESRRGRLPPWLIDALLVSIGLGALGLMAVNLLVRRENALRSPPHLVANWRDFTRAGNRVGPADAPVLVVNFVDYECPFCRVLDERLIDVQRSYSSQVALIYRHYPISSIHPNAYAAAMAAECAAERGAFQEYSQALYTHARMVQSKDWIGLARLVGIADIAAIRECLSSKRPQRRIAQDVAAAKTLGVVATPTLLINGRFFSGAMPAEVLRAEVERALRPPSLWSRIRGWVVNVLG